MSALQCAYTGVCVCAMCVIVCVVLRVCITVVHVNKYGSIFEYLCARMWIWRCHVLEKQEWYQLSFLGETHR